MALGVDTRPSRPPLRLCGGGGMPSSAPLALLVLCVSVRAALPPPVSSGVLLDSVVPSSAGEAAGLRAGDLLLTWSRPAGAEGVAPSAAGTFASPFDLREVEATQAPLGAVRLTADRGGSRVEASLGPGEWGLNATPRLGAADRAEYLAGAAAVSGGHLWEGLDRWRGLEERMRRRREEATACWLALHAAATLERAKERAGADLALARALEMAPSRLAAEVLEARFHARVDRQELAAAREALAELRGRLAAVPGGSLRLAALLQGLARAERRRGDFSGAERDYREALGIWEREAPGSDPLADAQHGLGNVALARMDFLAAEECYQRSLAIRERTRPGSQLLANTLGNLGTVARGRGDLAAAEALQRRALAIEERLPQDSVSCADTLQSLGILAFDRGNLVVAEDYYQRALARYSALDPEGADVAGILNNLGALAYRRWDLEASGRYFERALALKEHLAPDTLAVVSTLNNLGSVRRDQGEFDEADRLFTRAQAICDARAPGGVQAGTLLSSRAQVAEARGDAAGAEVLHRRALEFKQTQSPDSPIVAGTLQSLGNLAARRGDTASAEASLARALSIWRRCAPGTKELAYTAHDLGRLHAAMGELEKARGFLREAVDAFEAQRGKVGGGREITERYTARSADLYRDAVDLDARVGRAAEAFETLEKFRARSLLEMLAERDLDFRKDAPEALLREESLASAELRKLQVQLAGLSPARDEAEIERIGEQLGVVKARRSEIEGRLREVSPALASLRYPTPLSAAEAGALLEPKTLLLSYCVGEDRTWLFILAAGRLDARPIAVGREELSRRCRVLCRMLADPLGPAEEKAGRARALYDLLLGPASSRIRRSDLLLICPDGPLHNLPFAALMPSAGRYLVEEVPVSTVLSATLLKELRGRPFAGPEGPALCAFGGCEYGPPGPGRPSLDPLPASEAEVERIAASFPGKARLFVGRGATEEVFRRLSGEVRFLHFACHGVLNERFPLDSALALSVPPDAGPGGEDGMLQAWEIFEGVRVRTDLVVLSACQTALGEDRGGEGLVGLTRAFQYAGARAVLSSLWSVSDGRTAELMARFYEELQRGRGKAQALQRAQVACLRGAGPKVGSRKSGASSPFAWAGFVLSGDGR